MEKDYYNEYKEADKWGCIIPSAVVIAVVIILTLFGVSGCKTKQMNLETKQAIEQQSDRDTHQETKEESNSNTEKVLTDNSTSNQNIETESTVTEYSEPDEDGNQYIKKQTHTKSTTSNENAADVKEQSNSQNSSIKDAFIDESIDTMLDSYNEVEHYEKTKATTPMWVYMVILALVLAIMLVAIWWVRKLKLRR